MTTPTRFQIADGFISVGDVVPLSDGRSVRVLAFSPVGTLPVGTMVIDPRNDIVCAVTQANTEWPVILNDDMCAMPTEVMPVVDIVT